MNSESTIQNAITVRVPGSTSNLGSGFDTLGLALRVYNWVRLTPSPLPDTAIHVTSSVSPEARSGTLAMISETARYFFDKTGTSPIGFAIDVRGDVPVARGLGSSTTVQLGCLVALNECCNTHLDRQALFEMVCHLEGHPDNAAPAVFGGFTVAGPVDNHFPVVRFPSPPRLRFVAVIPDHEVKTSDARKLLPDKYSRQDLVHSLNRTALVTAALAAGKTELLRGLFDDRVHQPYRKAVNPLLEPILETAMGVGAIGGWLSGSGSTVICITDQDTDTLAATLRTAFPTAQILVLGADRRGFQIE